MSRSIHDFLLQNNSVEIETKDGEEGLFTFYQNQENGSLQLLVK